MLRTGTDLRQGDIKELLDTALRKISPDKKPQVAGEPEVRQITAAEYSFYQRLIHADKAPVPLPVLTSGDLELRQLLAAEPTWQIKLVGEATKFLKSLIVEFQDGKKRTYTPAKDQGDLTLTQANTYTIRFSAGAEPKSYELEFALLDEKEKPVVLKGDWPVKDNYFYIRLNDFSGKSEELFKTLQDTNVPNSLDKLDVGKNVTIAVGEGSLADDLPTDLALRNNQLVVIVPPLKRGKAARAWMYFPLKKDDVAKELAKYADLTPRGVSDAIAKSTPVRAGDNLVITKGMAPRWIELPLITKDTAAGDLKADTFGRMIPLVAAPPAAVKPEEFEELLKAIPAAHCLLVYEFGDKEGQRQALRYKANAAQKNQRFVNESELGQLGQWALLLKTAAAGAKGGPAKPGPAAPPPKK